MSCHFITNVWHQCSFLTKNCVLAHFTLDRYEEKNDLGAGDGAFGAACHRLRGADGRADHDCDEFLSDVCADAERDGRR